MIKLIKNELTKIFKKKSLYITLLITLIFIIICNFIYKLQDSNNYNYEVEISFYEQQLKELNLNNKEDIETYIIYKSELDQAKLEKSYGGYDTWQARIIQEQLAPIIQEMNEYQYKTKNQTAYENAKKEYDAIIAKIDAGDWRYFANEELKEVESTLAQQNKSKDQMQNASDLDNQIYMLELQKQVLNWRLEKDIPYGNDYKNTCLNKYQSAKMSIKQYESASDKDKENYEAKQEYYSNLERAAIAKYDIENETTTGDESNARGILLDVFNQFELFIIIMGVMIAGTIVSEEFSKGTVKLLLIKPYKRATILASKFITCLIILVIVMLLVIAMQFVVGGIAQGFDSYTAPAVVYNHNTNELQEVNMLVYLAMQALGKMPIYILLMTLAFSVSTIFSNSALAITIGLLGYMGSPFVNQLGIVFKLNWLKFFVTPNWDLTQYFFGGLPTFQGLTPIFSGIIIVLYMLIMLIPTFIIFKKKNIKNI